MKINFLENGEIGLQLQNEKAALKRKTEELELTSKDLELLSQFISHDLKSPIGGILGITKLILENHSAELLESVRANLERIIHVANRLLLSSEGMMNLVSLTHRDLTLEKMDISKICNAIVNELTASEPTRKMEISIVPNLQAFCDASLMDILLRNLIQNALKFTRFCVNPQINIGQVSETNSSQTTFFVKDNGVGFHMDHAENLFSPFERLHLSQDFNGIGFGLAISKKIVDRHGGTIWAEAAPNYGATFYFTL